MTKQLLMLPATSRSGLRLEPGNLIEDAGARGKISFNPLDPSQFGRPYATNLVGSISWTATTTCRDADKLDEVYPFYAGAMISPRVREIIENSGAEEVEFIPLTIVDRVSRAPVADWWFVNVFHWLDVFDFKASNVTWQDFAEPVTGWSAFEKRFGDQRIRQFENLTQKRPTGDDRLFLVRAPTEVISAKVFVGYKLAELINRHLPKNKKVMFEVFPKGFPNIASFFTDLSR